MVVLAGAMSVVSYLAKTPCSGPPYDAQGYSTHLVDSYRLLCLTDIQYLWVGRGVDTHQFPYVEGRLEPGDGPPGQLADGAVEYPVLTGLVMWMTGLPASNSGEYLAWNALMLFPVALAIGWLLATLVGWRAAIVLAAPAMVFYSVYNWDLLPVALTLAAVLAWRRDRYAWAGALLGLGAATKIYPGFFLLPLVLERWLAGDRRSAVAAGTAGAAAWLVPNAPFMAVNFEGWWATYAFQAGRVPTWDTNSIWFWGFPDWPLARVDRVSLVLIAACWVLALLVGWARPVTLGAYPWIQVSAAMLCAFLAFNKVYSPQYVLWVLPFLALLSLRWGWWVACWCVDVTLFVGVVRWFHDFNDDLARQAASIGGWGKTVLFLLLYVVVLRTPLALRSSAGPDPASRDDLEQAPIGLELLNSSDR